jgi:hypothetical protein
MHRCERCRGPAELDRAVIVIDGQRLDLCDSCVAWLRRQITEPPSELPEQERRELDAVRHWLAEGSSW